jgi:hypothetical protein
MSVVKWIIRGVLGLIALAALGFGVILIWPEILVPEYSPKIGTGFSRGASYVDVVSRWGPPKWCTPELSNINTSDIF